MTKKEESRIRSMRKAGKSIKDIAKAMHISDKRISAFLKLVKAENKIELPYKNRKKNTPTKKPVVANRRIDLVWKDGRIVKANRKPTELLVFGHSVITYALSEIVKGVGK